VISKGDPELLFEIDAGPMPDNTCVNEAFRTIMAVANENDGEVLLRGRHSFGPLTFMNEVLRQTGTFIVQCCVECRKRVISKSFLTILLLSGLWRLSDDDYLARSPHAP
jgi:hypothetical protein